MPTIAQYIAEYSDVLAPLKEAAGRYLIYPSELGKNGVLQIGHRPWVAKLNYVFTLYPGISRDLIDQYAQHFQLKIPQMYIDFLHEVNGAFCFGMSLCGIPPSMLGKPPLLDRSVLQCHDLATAATAWVRGYRVPRGYFHFGGRHFSYKENVGYFIDGGKRIVCAKQDGTTVGEWTGFTDFLTHELPQSEKLEEELHPPQWDHK
jgi:hypothetical protein